MTTIYSPSRRNNVQLLNNNSTSVAIQQPKNNYQLDSVAFNKALDKAKFDENKNTQNRKEKYSGDNVGLNIEKDISQKHKLLDNFSSHRELRDARSTIDIISKDIHEKFADINEEAEKENQRRPSEGDLSVFVDVHKSYGYDSDSSDGHSDPETLIAISEARESTFSPMLQVQTSYEASTAAVDINGFFSMFDQLNRQQALSATQFLAEKKWSFSLQDNHLPVVGLMVTHKLSGKWDITLLSDSESMEHEILTIYSDRLKDRLNQYQGESKDDYDISISIL